MRTERMTTLKRQATDLLADIEREKPPILEGIARGEMAIAEGRVISHADAKLRLVRWLK